MSTYAADLAYVHDVGFTEFVRQARPYLLQQFASHGITSGTIVDLGCGTGVWVEQLVKRDYDAWGVDISRAMLAIAKKRAPSATFRCESLYTARLPRSHAVTALGEVFNYQFDGRANTKSLGRLFSRVFQSLEPGGLFIFDIACPGRGRGRTDWQRHWQSGDWALLLTTNEDRKTQTLTREMTVFRRVGRAYRRSREVHRLRLYRPRDIARQLRAVGFRVRHETGYGNAHRWPGIKVLVARKPLTATA